MYDTRHLVYEPYNVLQCVLSLLEREASAIPAYHRVRLSEAFVEALTASEHKPLPVVRSTAEVRQERYAANKAAALDAHLSKFPE